MPLLKLPIQMPLWPNLHYGPSMMSHWKTPWKDPEGFSQLLRDLFRWKMPKKAVITPRCLFKGSFTVTSLTVHSVGLFKQLLETYFFKNVVNAQRWWKLSWITTLLYQYQSNLFILTIFKIKRLYPYFSEGETKWRIKNWVSKRTQQST